MRRRSVAWYGGGTRRVGLLSRTGHWYKSGAGLVPIRWVFVRDRDGRHRDELFFNTDPTLDPVRVIETSTARWKLELSADLPTVWQATTTTPAERQRRARILIEWIAVTVDKASERVGVEIHWFGGLVEVHTLSRPVKRYDLQSDYPRLVERLRDWGAEEFSRSGDGPAA